jgi:cytochrome c peroxidase
MGQTAEEALTVVLADREYRADFEKAFKQEATVESMAIALASFERTLVSGDSRFDRFLYGSEQTALTPEEKKGLDIFSTRAGCLNCHDVFHPRFNALGGGVALFTDFRFHNLGVGYKSGRFKDPGRYGWSRDPNEWGAFRTPPLRNLTLTAPYMHDGSLKTLEEVVEFYDRGGNSNPNISPSIHPLYLTSEEKRLLVVFLKTLTSPEAQLISADANKLNRPMAP